MEITMHIYAQLDDNGRTVALTQAAGPLDGPGLVELASYDDSVLGQCYDRAASMAAGYAVFVPAPVVAPTELRQMSVLAFRRRFTPAERAAIEWAAVDRSDQTEAQRMQAAAVRASLADQAAATFIDMDDADTAQGVLGLEAAGLIAAGRAAEIMNAPVQPGERQ